MALMPRPARALLIYAVLLTGCPDRRLQDARALVEEGRFKEAGAAFVALAKADPANLAAWDGAVQLWCRDQINVGECVGVLDLELKLLGSLQRHRDALSEVLERRARARLQQGMIESALADLKRAAEAAPERPSVYAAQARAHMMRGARTEMLNALDHAKKLDPKNAEADELYRWAPGNDDDAIGEAGDGPAPEHLPGDSVGRKGRRATENADGVTDTGRGAATDGTRNGQRPGPAADGTSNGQRPGPAADGTRDGRSHGASGNGDDSFGGPDRSH